MIDKSKVTDVCNEQNELFKVISWSYQYDFEREMNTLLQSGYKIVNTFYGSARYNEKFVAYLIKDSKVEI